MSDLVDPAKVRWSCDHGMSCDKRVVSNGALREGRGGGGGG